MCACQHMHSLICEHPKFMYELLSVSVGAICSSTGIQMVVIFVPDMVKHVQRDCHHTGTLLI